MSARSTFVGFGFGAIQGGLFLHEASQSCGFDRLVVAEVLPEVVNAMRRAGGCYRLNVATRHGVDIHEIKGIEVFNPTDPSDRDPFLQALSEASEIATALPSVEFFTCGEPSAATLLARALERKCASTGMSHPPCVVYTAENHNHAAEILDAAIRERIAPDARSRLAAVYQPLNTVIGKMSKVVLDTTEIQSRHLATVTPGAARALLVEEFNRILITQIVLPGFVGRIRVFEEKPNLLPFEEAKLYGHNAVHLLLGCLAHHKGCRYMSEAATDAAMMRFAREAFIEESGRALLHRHAGLDPLFTPDGLTAYADDLLERMVNPNLHDSVERVIRDPRRKLGWDDRLVGTMRLALDAGIKPVRFARAAFIALDLLRAEQPQRLLEDLLADLWSEPDQPVGRKEEIIRLIMNSGPDTP